MGAHPHQVVFDPSGRWLVVPDKGADTVYTIAFDQATGAMEIAESMRTAPGSGPRHMVFDAQRRNAWIVLELTSQVLSVSFDPETGTMAAKQRVSSVPESFTGENTGAGIALAADGLSLYVSNRGHGSVAKFQIDSSAGIVHSPEWASTRGTVPRFISLQPGAETLLVANEDADSIVAIHTSTFQTPGEILARTGSPVCITFIEGTS